MKERPRDLFYYTTQEELNQILKTGYISSSKLLANRGTLLRERKFFNEEKMRTSSVNYENDPFICFIKFKANEVPVQRLDRLPDGRSRWHFPSEVSIYSVSFGVGRACKRVPITDTPSIQNESASHRLPKMSFSTSFFNFLMSILCLPNERMGFLIIIASSLFSLFIMATFVFYIVASGQLRSLIDGYLSFMTQ